MPTTEKKAHDTVQGNEGDQESPIMARLAALEATTKAQEKNTDRLARLATTLATRQPTVTTTVPAQAADVDVFSFEGLPDPVKDGPGYAKALGKRLSDTINTQVEKRVQVIRAEVDTTGSNEKRIERLWEKFNDKYDEFSDMEDLVEIAARAEIAERVEGGTPVEQAVFMDPNGFMEAVAERARARLKKLGVKPKKVGDADTDEDEADDTVKGGEALRTGGLSMDIGGIPGGKAKGKPEKAEDLVDTIKVRQKALGMF